MYVTFNLIEFLPPANEVCEGYVFTPVCQSFQSQGDMHGEGGACVVKGGGMGGWRGSHCSGRYASYWNAFLFLIEF